MDEIKLIKENHEEELLAKENVVGVAVGYKYVGGVRTDEISVVVDVSQKVPLGTLPEQDRVPAELEGTSTDVIEVGSIVPFWDPTQKYRPAPGGVSIGHRDVTAGTLGIVISKKDIVDPEPGESFISVGGVILGWPIAGEDKLYILSNNHVLANSNEASIGDPIYQPGSYDGGTLEDTIALLSQFVPIDFNGGPNKVDCALAEPIDVVDVTEREILVIGNVSGTIEATLGMNVRKYGRTTQYTNNIVTQINATVVVSYPGDKIAIFEDQIITPVMADGGDSGSLLVKGDEQKAVGLLFAGSSMVTVFNNIKDVEVSLGIQL